MALRSSGGRKLSFDILSDTTSHPEDDYGDEYSLLLHRSKSHPPRNIPTPSLTEIKKTKKKKKKKYKKKIHQIQNGSHPSDAVLIEDKMDSYSYTGGEGSVTCTLTESRGSGELRQRNVSSSNGSLVIGEKEEVAATVSFSEEKGEANGSVVIDDTASSGNEEKERTTTTTTTTLGPRLETVGSLDWKKLMAEDPNNLFSIEQSPFKYFMDEMHKGNSLKSTTSSGSDKERERVYDTIFHLPWRCELLIDVGFFVCFDSFLSLLTVMPTRIVMILWKVLYTRQFKKPSAAELSDIGCFIVLASGVVLLGRTDISLIYHMIRGQGTIKLYVVYNVLEIFDKLCQSFGGDVLQTLFNSSEGLAGCSPENSKFWIWRFVYDQALTTAFSILHSFILLAQAITLSTCIVAHNNALLALLVSNNFAEIKSNVFKRFSKENIHSLVYSDSVERFHISAFLVFVLAQNLLEAEGPWFESFLSNAVTVFFCEVLIDIIKHSFLAKFNDLKPIAYSEFLEELCKQTLDIQTDSKKKNLTFVPLAPAAVVIRVLTPVYAAHLPCNPPFWRLSWILLLVSFTYVMLTSLKVMIGIGLQKHASWYIKRCRRRKQHFHFD